MDKAAVVSWGILSTGCHCDWMWFYIVPELGVCLNWIECELFNVFCCKCQRKFCCELLRARTSGTIGIHVFLLCNLLLCSISKILNCANVETPWLEHLKQCAVHLSVFAAKCCNHTIRVDSKEREFGGRYICMEENLTKKH